MLHRRCAKLFWPAGAFCRGGEEAVVSSGLGAWTLVCARTCWAHVRPPADPSCRCICDRPGGQTGQKVQAWGGAKAMLGCSERWLRRQACGVSGDRVERDACCGVHGRFLDPVAAWPSAGPTVQCAIWREEAWCARAFEVATAKKPSSELGRGGVRSASGFSPRPCDCGSGRGWSASQRAGALSFRFSEGRLPAAGRPRPRGDGKDLGFCWGGEYHGVDWFAALWAESPFRAAGYSGGAAEGPGRSAASR